MDDLVGDMSGSRIMMGANGVGAVQADDSKAMVWFKREPKLMVAQSEIQGRQIWEDRDYAYVHQPGDTNPVRIEAFAMHQRRWPKAWAAYQAGRTEIPDGTMLSILFPADPGIPLNLKTMGVHTIEQLAEVEDSLLHNIPFGGTLKQKAIKYMASAKGAEGFNKLSGELAQKDAEIRSLQMQMAEMQKRMSELAPKPAEGVAPASTFTMEQVAQIIAMAKAAEPEKRGPGRPPKQEN